MGSVVRQTMSRTVGADAFIASVEIAARRSGHASPGLNHWLLAVCSRQFLARTLLRGLDLAEVRARAQRELDSGEAGAPVTAAEILAAASRNADADTRSLHEWHLVLAVIERAGLSIPPTADIRTMDVAPFTSGDAVARDRAFGSTADTAIEPPSAAGPIGDAFAADESVANLPAPNPSPPPARVETTGGAAAARAAPPRASPAAAVPAPPPRPFGPVLPPPRVRPTRPPKKTTTPVLDECGTDLTALAETGALGPVVGRDPEIGQLIETLCRPSKANPMLVGEPGVGKSALVEGLAQRIAAGDVPSLLWGRRVIALDMSGLLRDSRYYGKLEERLAAVVAEARASRAILFIDESHAIVGAGGREGSGDVATLLKPALARGDLALIGATTDDEYRRIVAADGALERRFVVIRVQEPGRDAVREILRAVRDAEARRTGVHADDPVLEHVLAIAAGRLPHRREPDRSIDLLEQCIAAALASGRRLVDADAVDAAAAGLAGIPVIDERRLDALETELAASGELDAGSATAIVDRLRLTTGGLGLHPARPRAVVLLLHAPGSSPGDLLAETIARHVAGGIGEIVALDVGRMTEPAMLSALLGTSQGYVGYDAALPIHRIAQKPYSVVRVQGVDRCHPLVRDVLAKAIVDGFIADATGRRTHLSSTVLIFEATSPAHSAGSIGFGRREGSTGDTTSLPLLASSLLGDTLASEIDVDVATSPTASPRAHVGHLLRDLAAQYAVVGVDLRWDDAAERLLGEAAAALATRRQRERFVEDQVARAVRPHLGRRGERGVRLEVTAGGAELEVRAGEATGTAAGDRRDE